MIKIQVKLDDKTRELVGDVADQHEEPVECVAFLMFAFGDGSVETRACGPLNVLEVAYALATTDDKDLEKAICLAAARIAGDRS